MGFFVTGIKLELCSEESNAPLSERHQMQKSSEICMDGWMMIFLESKTPIQAGICYLHEWMIRLKTHTACDIK